jgi:hypothetical protein
MKQDVALNKGSLLLANFDSMVNNLNLLAVAYNQSLSPEQYQVYWMALADLTAEQLAYGYKRAVCELKWWPKPSELREMCTGCAASMADKLRVDAAWNWTQQYIDMFGVPARNRWEIQGHAYKGDNPAAAVRGSRSLPTFATTAPFYEVMLTAVPDLPELVEATLKAMSGSVEVGLSRLNGANQAIPGVEGAAAKDSAFARKDWDEFCARAIAATRMPAASYINPTLQLTGHVAPEFSIPTPKAIAVHIELGSEGYTFTRLTFEEAAALYEAGKLPLHLYEDEVRRHQVDEENEKLLATNEEFIAVYLEKFRPLEQRDNPVPCRMGLFTIENAEGSRVICASLPMGVGNLELMKGQTIHFTAMRKDLRYEDYQRIYFDLQAMTVSTAAPHSTNPNDTAKDAS